MKKYKTLEEFFADQKPDDLKQILAIRDFLFKTEPKLIESLKWNAPNYNFKGEDRITFNLMNKEKKVKVIIHMGAKKKENKKGKPVMYDRYGLVEWNSDIRGMIMFDSIKDVKAKGSNLKKLIKEWISIK